MFNIKSQHKPRGDQPKAIEDIVSKLDKGEKNIVLMGVTGSGKTFTMANIIAKTSRPALIIAPNKTLAAQLYEEMKLLFPDSAVSYFVSYYDYYQPEAYLPASDTYIEKDSSINEEIDKLRHTATRALLTRKDVVIVASVSCIYGLGSPEEYSSMSIVVSVGENIRRSTFLKKLIGINYERDDLDFSRGKFRARGDTIEIFPVYEEDIAYRVEFFGDEVDRITIFDPLTGITRSREKKISLYPASHYATSKEIIARAIKSIQVELRERIIELKSKMRLMEAKRIEERTYHDIELMEELGYCKGIENYSRHLTGRKPGEAPPTLIEYFPSDFILFIDESHISIPQIGGMYKGDRSRKSTLVEHGFRLPSALDNRPLNFEEFQGMINQVVYVSATPGNYELEKGAGNVVEQIIRPTGLVDPEITILPCKYQIDSLMNEIKKTVSEGGKVLVTTLTKKMAEDISEYYTNLGLRVKYLHSDISTLERIDIINDLRKNVFDVLVGINLLREGLDIPEVSLVAILDADKEGFLRSSRSLIQTIGRAARNVDGRVIMYADKITGSIKNAVEETDRRRKIQEEYNKIHNITPKTVSKGLQSSLFELTGYNSIRDDDSLEYEFRNFKTTEEIDAAIKKLDEKMREHARKLEFDDAARIRDRIAKLKIIRLELG